MPSDINPEFVAPGDPPRGDKMTFTLWRTLVILLLAQFVMAVDFSILNVALPEIGTALGFSLSGIQWIVTSFALAAAGFTLFFGRLGDYVGRLRLFVTGMIALGVASLVGGLAESQSVLLAARVAQGLATAMVTPTALSLLTTSFPEGSLRDRALGMNGAIMSAGFTTGAIMSGVLLDMLSWRWLFFINVPIAIIVAIMAPMVIREPKRETRLGRANLDMPGAVLVTATVLALIYGITSLGDHGAEAVFGVEALILSAVLFMAFLFVESRAAEPLVPLAILKRRSVLVGNFSGLLAFATETSLVFLMTLYMQKVLGQSGTITGAAFAVLGFGTVMGGVFAPRVMSAIGTKGALLSGFALQGVATSALILLSLDASASMPILLVATFLGGIGNMLAIVGFMTAATSGLPNEQQGLATGLAILTQQFGITIGIPIMSAIATARMTSLGGTAGSEPELTILDGVVFAVMVNVALVALGFLGAMVLKSEEPSRGRQQP
ncbi:MFS transporter [Pseudoroseicyclus aestuarii]|uniref:EmrB/QacA subfamily drug resistance transporter n=1 Tax=Pseudoroseicyclus aestuarii TaxID=1795041 RepID=A0A318SM21_9RHOB|nr:MFS transporter [Pseudoroseicyclus aestuarii]PYE80571.1 EmrB/QacA subfamily drug resistance transporter [Pseudoroseicyclus aestuarii]